MRGAATASAASMLRSITLTMTCSTVVMMRLPPGEPVTISGRPFLRTMVGRHRRQRPLARAGRVGVAADQPVGVGRGGPRGEIVELVVEQHAGAVGDQADAVAEIERVGVGDRVAVAVDHREMRGVVAFARQQQVVADLARRRGALGIDAGAQLRGVALATSAAPAARSPPRDRRDRRRGRHRRAASPRSSGAGATASSCSSSL